MSNNPTPPKMVDDFQTFWAANGAQIDALVTKGNGATLTFSPAWPGGPSIRYWVEGRQLRCEVSVAPGR